MDSGTFDSVYNTIHRYNMLKQGDKVIVGVSGGPDSLCLLHILNRIKEEKEIEIHVAHVNHGLRGEAADLDQMFIEQFAQKLNLEVHSKKVDVKDYARRHKMTLEEAGREVRYSFFKEIFTVVKADKIAVGHNLNDNVETFLFNLLRGSGMEGLKGIEPVRGELIRPLIETERDRIEAYCNENGLVPRIDATNADTVYTRNKIRHQLLPFLKENFNNNIFNSLNRTAKLLSDENTFISEAAQKYYSECFKEAGENKIILSLKKFNKLDIAIKRRILRKAIENIQGDLRCVEKTHIDNALDILEREKTGQKIQIPKSIVINIQYGNMIIAKAADKSNLEFKYLLTLPGQVRIDELGMVLNARFASFAEVETIKNSKYVCLLDYDKLQNELDSNGTGLVVRTREKGDVINPSGMFGSKKLKDYFIDEKIAREERDGIPLVAVGNEIIWVVGRRYTEKYKISNTTKEVLVLEYAANE